MLDRAVKTLPAVGPPPHFSDEHATDAAAPSWRAGLGIVLLLGMVSSLGFGLRFYCAGNDLWMDEIWSLQLVRGLTSPDQIFWRISHDNNHYLNSLWLYALGPGQSARLYRLPAVLFGTLSILVAAHLGMRRGRASGFATAALVATSYLMVNYGSEARGYAGMLLALLIALDACDSIADASFSARSGSRNAFAGSDIDRQRWILGAAIGIGALFHLTLFAALPVFGAAIALRQTRAGHSPIVAAGAALMVLRPGLLLAVPALACLAIGIVVRGRFAFGDASPFELSAFLRGFGDMLHIVTAMPEAVPLPLVIGATGLGLLVAARTGRLDIADQCLVLAGLVVLPLGMVLLRLPNLEYARYFLIPAVILMVAQGRIVGALWDLGGRASRVTAAAILTLLMLGQVAWIQPLITVGRGSYGRALDIMASEGRTTYSSNSQFFTQSVVDVLAASRNQAFDYVDPSRFCGTPPDWHIVISKIGAERLEIGPDDCQASFIRRASFPTSSLSGMQWTLYRRSSAGRSPIVDSMR